MARKDLLHVPDQPAGPDYLPGNFHVAPKGILAAFWDIFMGALFSLLCFVYHMIRLQILLVHLVVVVHMYIIELLPYITLGFAAFIGGRLLFAIPWAACGEFIVALLNAPFDLLIEGSECLICPYANQAACGAYGWMTEFTVRLLNVPAALLCRR